MIVSDTRLPSEVRKVNNNGCWIRGDQQIRRRPAIASLRNYAAGDAVAGIPRGIGLLVVSFRVDYERRAAIAEERMAVGA